MGSPKIIPGGVIWTTRAWCDDSPRRSAIALVPCQSLQYRRFMTTMPKSHAAHARTLLRIGLPLVGSHLAQFGIVMTDTIMLGWYGAEILAAQVLGGTLFFVVFIVASGFAWAILPLIAEQAESGNDTQVRRVTRMGIWLSMIAALVSMPLFLLAGPLYVMLGQVPETSAMAGEYLAIAGWALFPALLVNVLKSYLAALERTRIQLWVTIVGVCVNALINYALIFGNWGMPELGIRGAAIASLAVSTVMAMALAGYAIVILPQHSLFVRLWRPDWSAFRVVFALGWPIGLTNLAESGLFSASFVMVGWLGTNPLAAHGIALQLASLSFMFHLGLSNAATVIAGQAVGRRDREGLRTAATTSLCISLGFAATAMVVFLLIPETLIGAFLDPDDPAWPEVLALGTTFLFAAALFQAVDGAQVMALGLLRGVQDTRGPMIIAAVSYWIIGVPVSYVLAFPLGMEGLGIWLGLAVGLAFAAVLLTRRFYTVALGSVGDANGSSG